MMSWWLLVTGTGRCGTGYVAHVLSSAGVRCTHEGLFSLDAFLDGSVWSQVEARRAHPEWNWEGESSWMAAPYLDRLGDLAVIHLVRRPEDVIASHQRMRNWDHPGYEAGRQWIYDHMLSLEQVRDPVARSARFVLDWNALVVPYTTIRHRVEDDVENLLDQLGIDYKDKVLFNNQRYNTRQAVPYEFSPDHLPTDLWAEVKALGEQYGYAYH